MSSDRRGLEPSGNPGRPLAIFVALKNQIIDLEARRAEQDVKSMRDTGLWRAAIAFDHRSIRRVAEEYGVSKSTVARFRKAFGVHQRGRGRPFGGKLPDIQPRHLV